MKLSVIGCGHLGAVHASCMANIGHEVLGVEIDESRAKMLNSGKSWFHEPGLDQMLSRNVAAGRLRFTTSFTEAAQFSLVHFLGVATPGLPDGTYDLSQVRTAVAELAQHITQPSVIIGKSTVPPGTTASLSVIAAGISQHSIDIAWNPEFLREGSAIQDTLMPHRIVIGTASDAAEAVLREIYRPLTDAGTPLVITDFATAELVKGAANAFLATKISFINAMADICRTVGGDVHALATALGMDPRIGKSFLTAGIGYGGGCLPKDVRGLAGFADQAGMHGTRKLLMAVDEINAARREDVVRIVIAATTDLSVPTDSLSGKRIAVWGAAFKPGTDDIRDSPGLDIAGRLHDCGAHVTVYDPMAMTNALEVSPELTYADSAVEAARDADTVLVVAAWPEFACISPFAAEAAVASRTIVDACQSINYVTWREAGWKVLSLTDNLVEAEDGPIRRSSPMKLDTSRSSSGPPTCSSSSYLLPPARDGLTSDCAPGYVGATTANPASR
jgi:UDPglucose 6-dehydrogenase